MSKLRSIAELRAFYSTVLMYMVFIWRGRNDFDVGKSILKGWALKIETFFGPEMVTSEESFILPEISRDFQGPPLPMT